MTRAARRQRRRVFGAVGSALGLLVGLVVAVGLAGATHAGANPSGASPNVYLAGSGGVGATSIKALRSGGASLAMVGSILPGNVAGPIAINSTATRALAAGSPSGAANGVAVINVSSNTVVGFVTGSGQPIGFAMDPTDSDRAFALDNTGAVDRLGISGSSPTSTRVIASLPAGPNFGPVTPTSIAISPDGQTLFIGWWQRDYYGIYAIPLTNPAAFTQWSVRTGSFNRLVDVAVAPDGHRLFAAQTDGFTVTSTFEVSFPLPPPGSTTWSRVLPSPLLAARGLTVSPDGRSIYVVGTGGNSSNSAVQALDSAHGALGASRTIPVASDSDGVGGLDSIAETPDQTTLIVDGLGFSPSGSATVSLYSLSVPGLGTLGVSTFPSSFGSTTSPEGIAITPDQAPNAHISAPSSVQVGQPITFDASSSTVKYGSVTTFAWNFGDGNTTTTGSPVVTHTYSAANSDVVTVTETDSAGTSTTTGVAGVAGPVDSAGQTPYRLASPSAATSVTVEVTVNPPPPPTTTTTTVAGHAHTSTTTGGHHVASVPTLVLNPAVGPPGTIVTVTGAGYRANTAVTVAWSASSGSVVITADKNGNLPPTPLLILTPDVLGPRFAEASSTPQAVAPFLVVPSDSEPGGDNAGLLFRSEGP